MRTKEGLFMTESLEVGHELLIILKHSPILIYTQALPQECSIAIEQYRFVTAYSTISCKYILPWLHFLAGCLQKGTKLTSIMLLKLTSKTYQYKSSFKPKANCHSRAKNINTDKKNMFHFTLRTLKFTVPLPHIELIIILKCKFP